MYLKKNVNLMLLALVLTVLIGTVAITTYFKSTYTEVSQNLESKSQQLQVVSSNFSQKISELNKTAAELQLKELDKDKLDQLYTELLKEKEKLDGELALTREKLTETINTLGETKAELSDANYNLMLQEDELADLNVKVQNLGNTIKSRNTEIDILKKQLCDEKQAQGKTC